MTTSKKIILVGGSGYLGHALAEYFLAQQCAVVTISRKSPTLHQGERFAAWDACSLGPWAQELSGAEAVINLAGRIVDCRYTLKNRAEMMNSRIESTRILGQAIADCSLPPKIWLNASTATIYRNAYDRAQSESTGEFGKGFSVDIAKAWENELFSANTPQTRKVALRAAMVLGPGEGGVWLKLRNIISLGLGGRAGSGKQYFSWIHLQDFLKAIAWIIDHPELSGPINLAAPDPRPNAEFMRLARKALQVKIGLPAPELVVELGAFLLRTETELLLKSRRVVPERLLASGYRFQFSTVENALSELTKV